MAIATHIPKLKRPYPGQLWKRDGVQALIVAVTQATVTYDNLTRGGQITESLDSFLAGFRRMKR
jgi:hypothetical protein